MVVVWFIDVYCILLLLYPHYTKLRWIRKSHFPHTFPIFPWSTCDEFSIFGQVVLWLFAVRMARFLRFNVIRCWITWCASGMTCGAWTRWNLMREGVLRPTCNPVSWICLSFSVSMVTVYVYTWLYDVIWFYMILSDIRWYYTILNV